MLFYKFTSLKIIAYSVLFSALSVSPGDAGRKKKTIIQSNKITSYFSATTQKTTPLKPVDTAVLTPYSAQKQEVKSAPVSKPQSYFKGGEPSVGSILPKVVVASPTPVKVEPSSSTFENPKLTAASIVEKKGPQLSITPSTKSTSASIPPQKTVAPLIQRLQKEPAFINNGNLASTVSKPPLSPKTIQQRKVETGAQIEQIIGRIEHFDEFIELIESAQKKIEIFSWTLDFLPEDAFFALKNAAAKGIEIILTVKEVRNEAARESLENLGVQINGGRITHTKLMYVDDRVAVVGSYNFLSKYSNIEDDDELSDSSFKISSDVDLVKKIRGRIYADMIRYEKGEDPLLTPWSHNLADNSRMHILSNLGHHQGFFRDIVAQATQKVVIYSPFIYGDNAKERLGEMAKTLKNNVSVTLYALEDHLSSLRWALNQHSSLKSRVIIKTTEAHRKSLIVDPDSPNNCYFSEGSFNWFCASNDLNVEARQETSIVVSGHHAKRLLESSDLEY